MCHVPSSVEFLGPTTPPVFKPESKITQISNQIDTYLFSIQRLTASSRNVKPEHYLT